MPQSSKWLQDKSTCSPPVFNVFQTQREVCMSLMQLVFLIWLDVFGYDSLWWPGLGLMAQHDVHVSQQYYRETANIAYICNNTDQCQAKVWVVTYSCVSQVVNYDPVPCKGCGAILNPHCFVDFASKVWTCPMCHARNSFPSNYHGISPEVCCIRS